MKASVTRRIAAPAGIEVSAALSAIARDAIDLLAAGDVTNVVSAFLTS